MQHVAAFSANEGVQREARLFAFYGRVSTEDNQDPEASRAWQLRRANALIEPKGGLIVAEFFDIDKSRSIPWARRPQATELITQLKNPARAFDAVVIGEPHRAFYGNQYSLTFPLFEHFNVPLWVPEVGGPIDPANEAHDMIMGVFGGLSKGERNRIKLRVRTAMAATEGRFLGGRPPYGYMLVDAGPHPNPAKAADGKRLHRLVPHPAHALVVKWILAQYIKQRGKGLGEIAEELTRQGIPSPSASDPGRNPHRNQVAWSKAAIRTILSNPRYTGREVWNKQRKDEVLIDIEDVALGTTTVMRWNDPDQWVWSEYPVHEAIVSVEDFEKAQQIRRTRAHGTYSKRGNPTQRPYVFRGRVFCGLCDRKMQGNWNNNQAYYRCRFPDQYAMVNKLDHPKVVYLREAEVIKPLEEWLATAFSPARIQQAIDRTLAETADLEPDPSQELRKQLNACDRKLARYREALDSGADAAEVTGWINQVTQERQRVEAELKIASHARPRKTTGREEIVQLMQRTGELIQAVPKASPFEKLELFQEIGLSMTYHPQKRVVEARVIPEPPHVRSFGVRGGTRPVSPHQITATGVWAVRASA